MRLFWFTVLCVCYAWSSASPLLAQEYNEVAFFDFNQQMRQAHEHAIRLRFKDCKLILQSEKSRNPYNLMPYYLDDVVDFFHVFTTENHSDFKRIQTQRDIRLAKLRTGDNASPYYLYSQAAIATHWAFLHIRFEEYPEAAKQLKKAFVDIEKNIKSFPDFIANKGLKGMIITLAGALSNDVRGGFQTDINLGLQLMQEAINYGKKYPKFEFNEETQILYALSLIELGIEEPKAWEALNTTVLDHTKSPMAAYILAFQHIESGVSSKALVLLEKVPTDENYHTFAYLDLMRGLCHLFKLDAKAEIYVKRFLDKYQGEHFIKDAYQKLGWIALLKGDNAKYKIYMGELRNKGNIVMPYDAAAEMEALSPTPPNIALLKTYLLFEGGYYDRAISEFNLCKEDDLKTDVEKIKYQYYKARLEQKMKHYDNALSGFNALINNTKNKTNGYVCASSYAIGQIWEERRNYEKAYEAYAACLKYNPDLFKKEWHDRARSRMEIMKEYKTNGSSANSRTGTVISPR